MGGKVGREREWEGDFRFGWEGEEFWMRRG